MVRAFVAALVCCVAGCQTPRVVRKSPEQVRIERLEQRVAELEATVGLLQTTPCSCVPELDEAEE